MAAARGLIVAAGMAGIPLEAGGAVADGIPGACFELAPGADRWPWVGDSKPILTFVERFLRELAASL